MLISIPQEISFALGAVQAIVLSPKLVHTCDNALCSREDRSLTPNMQMRH